MDGGSASESRTVRVLHAEDDEAFRERVAEMLADETWIELVSEPTPERALGRLSTERFDCVVSDYDGDDEAAFLPVIEASTDELPCILLTSTERARIDPAATAGIDEYLQKGSGSGRFDVLGERIRTHAERYWATERNRALFEAGGVPMVIHDAESGRIVDVNPQCADLLGYRRADATTLAISDLVPESGEYAVDRARRLVERAAAGETVTVEWEAITADGDRLPVEATLKRMEVAGTDRVVVTIQDIRGRKEREAALQRHKRSLERLHSAAQQLLGAERHEEVYETVVDAAESVLDPAYCAVVIREGDALSPVAVGGNEESVTAPESVPIEGSTEGQALGSGETQLGDSEYGRTLHVPIDDHGVLSARGYAPTRENARELGEVLASHAAVALGRADREAELQADRKRLESLAAAFPDYAFFYDADGEYEEVWLAADRETEMNITEELVGRSVQEMLDDDAAEAVQRAIDAAVATGSVQEVDYSIDGPAGTYWYEARAAALPEGVSGESEVVLVARDMTTQREYEKKLERQNERLDEFASLVSHDLRNPLNVIQGRLELIESVSDDEGVLEHATAAASASERMDALIDDLLTVARTDEQELSVRPVDLGEASTRAWSAVSEAKASIAMESDATVRADEAELIRLLENLFRNSVEHAGPDVSVRVEPLPDGFSVVDDGPGIDECYRDEVFESGFSTANDGTGYGLDIVERVADAHGWTVSLADTDAGARFDVQGVLVEEAAGSVGGSDPHDGAV